MGALAGDIPIMRKSPPTTNGSFLRFRLPPASHKAGHVIPPKRPRINDPVPYHSVEPCTRADLACYRCRQRKKKCCRSIPECSSCVEAGVQCQYPPKEDSFLTAREAQDLRTQIQWLSQQASATEASQVLSPTNTVTSVESISIVDGHQGSREVGISHFESDNPSTVRQSLVESGTRDELGGCQQPTLRLRLPDSAQPRHLIGVYFRHVHKAYPFLDQVRILQDLDHPTIEFHADANDVSLSPLVYILCAIGCATLHRIGEMSDEELATMSIPYKDLINHCLFEPGIETTSLLMLLTIYSVFDPDGISPWILSGMLGRQAIALGLNRRSSTAHGLSLKQVEERHRLFWSIYALAREIAASFGLPVAINDENINVPLPSVTIDEYASPSRVQHSRILQVCRNAVALREPEGRILQKIHLANPVSGINIGSAEHQGVIDQFNSQLDDWYVNGCLLSQLEDDDISFHDTIPWLNVRYHGLLILLHCPTRSNAYFQSGQLSCLYSSIHKYLQCSVVLLRQRHLMLHHSTLNRILVICLLLVSCVQQGRRSLLQSHDLSADIAFDIEILEAFSDRWLVAKRSLHVFQAIEGLLSIGNTYEVQSTQMLESHDVLKDIRNDALSLVLKTMGPSSIFNNLYEGLFASDMQSSSGKRGKVQIPVDLLQDQTSVSSV